LDGNYLGHYAIKKVAIGNSKPYLYKILQEVRLLEQLRHPNIIPYHHVWIEDAQFSRWARFSFGSEQVLIRRIASHLR
jgi:serine/threonine protein kinase